MHGQTVDNPVEKAVELGETSTMSPAVCGQALGLGTPVDGARGWAPSLTSTIMGSSTIHSTYNSKKKDLSLKERGWL